MLFQKSRDWLFNRFQIRKYLTDILFKESNILKAYFLVFNEFQQKENGLVANIRFSLVIHVHQILIRKLYILFVLCLRKIGADDAQIGDDLKVQLYIIRN